MTDPPAELPEVLSPDDDGRRVSLPVGAETLLRLPSDRSWQEPSVEGAAVVLSPVEYLVDPGYVEWAVRAAEPGEAHLAVTGEPSCEEPDECPSATVNLTFLVTD